VVEQSRQAGSHRDEPDGGRSVCALPRTLRAERSRQRQAGCAPLRSTRSRQAHGGVPLGPNRRDSTAAMTHIALTGTVNGKNVEWMEKVTDEQYNGK
jgi:hypothetical protein